MGQKNNSTGGSTRCPLSKNQEIRLTIDDLGNDGEGIGHYEGYAVFVKNALPKEVITASVMKVKKNYAYARLIRIEKSSPDRACPVCTNAGKCGGCTLQHMSYEAQLVYKDNKIKNCLMRIGGYEEAYLDGIREPILGMDVPYNYRNKAQFPVQRDTDGKIVTGFYAGHTHRIIPVSECHIQMPESNMIIGIVRDWMEKYGIEPYDETSHKGLIRHILTRIGKATGEIMVCLVATKKNIPCTESLVEDLMQITGMKSICINVNPDKTNKILGDKVYPLCGPLYIEDLIGDIRYRISPLSFYQVNPIQTVKLYNTALEYAGLTGSETVWDLYCGIGTISLFLARNAKKVLGVEIVPEAIEDAKVNAKINGIDNAVFVAGKAEEVAADVRYNMNNSTGINSEEDNDIVQNFDVDLPDISSPDVIVIDPPRKGCDATLIDTIVKVSPKRVVYVSCDPATLARDLKIFRESGYELVKYRGCDMFGMSGHVETVCLLSNRKPDAKVRIDIDLNDYYAIKRKNKDKDRNKMD